MIDPDFIEWVCTECKKENRTIRDAYNFFCQHCLARHSEKEVKEQEKK